MSRNKSKEIVKLTSLLGQDSLCDGDFVSPGSARIDGIVNGCVKVEGTLIVGSTGVINGDVEANAVQIGGEVYGNIYAPEHAELTSEAKVNGDLTTAVIVIDENAKFQGKVNMQVETVSEPVEKEKGGFFKKSIRKDKDSQDSVESSTLVDANNSIEEIYEENLDYAEEESDEEFIQRIINEV